MTSQSPFHKKSLIVILSYSPVGLGHLRVTQALYHGLPQEITPVLLGAQEKSISVIYRIISSHAIARSAMEFMQNGVAQTIFTTFYRFYLRNDTKILREQLLTLLEQRIDLPQTILVVATHYGLAHQLAAIKEELEKNFGITIILVVQVTDDSPQLIWYVYGADMLFVPSAYTKQQLEMYGKKEHLPKTPITVNGYPISPLLAPRLLNSRYEDREEQVQFHTQKELQISIPISGAAIGMDYYTDLITGLHKHLPRSFFHIVSKYAQFTQRFLAAMTSRSYVSVLTAQEDRAVVDLYEQMYREHTISLEVTKPSEQAFKVLFTPRQLGGALMLFATPVGRQEYDNVSFMRRHGLIPPKALQNKLFKMAQRNSYLLHDKALILAQAKSWRGVMLPKQAEAGVQFILWCLREGIFAAMMEYHKPLRLNEADETELSDSGVERFWQVVAELLQEK